MSSPNRRARLPVVLLAIVCAACPPAHAQSTPSPAPTGALTLDAAVRASLSGHPDLTVLDWRRQAADAHRLQAGLRPNPELLLDVENGPGSGRYDGLSQLETTLKLALPLEPAARRDARIQLADAERDVVDAQGDLLRLDIASGTARLFIDVVASQQALALTREDVQAAESMVRAAQARVDAGAASALEVARARISLERARLEEEHFEHLLLVQRNTLAAQWGAEAAGFDQAEAELLPLPPPVQAEDALGRLRSSPDFALYDVQARVHEATAVQAAAQQRLQPLVGVGLRRFEATDDVALVASLTLPLPVRDRGQGTIAAARAQAGQSRAEREAALLAAKAALFDLIQEERHSLTLVERLDAELIPQADAALALLERGYRSGRYTQLDWIDARRTRLELAMERLSSVADYHRLRVAIERMTALAAPTP